MRGATLDVSERFKALHALEQSQNELAEKAKALEEKNVALRELIAHIELDQKEFKDRITANIEQVLLPSLNRIQLHTSGDARIEQHRRSIEDLASSFYLEFAKALQTQGGVKAGIEAAVRGMAFVEALVESSNNNSNWTEIGA